MSYNYLDALQDQADAIANYQLKDKEMTEPIFESVATEPESYPDFPVPLVAVDFTPSDPASYEEEEPSFKEEANVSDSSSEDVTFNYVGLRDRAMQYAGAIPGVNYTDVDAWLDAVDKVEAKLATGKRMKND